MTAHNCGSVGPVDPVDLANLSQGETSSRATFLWECVGQQKRHPFYDVLLGGHNLPNTQTQPTAKLPNQPQPNRTNQHQSGPAVCPRNGGPAAQVAKAAQASAAAHAAAAAAQQVGSPQSQKITEKTQVFCEVDGGLLTSCYKRTFFVAEVRCQTHKLKHMYLYIIYLFGLFVYSENKNPLCIFVSFSLCQKKTHGIRTTFFVDGHYDSQRGPSFLFAVNSKMPLRVSTPNCSDGDHCINLLESVDGN